MATFKCVNEECEEFNKKNIMNMTYRFDEKLNKLVPKYCKCSSCKEDMVDVTPVEKINSLNILWADNKQYWKSKSKGSIY